MLRRVPALFALTFFVAILAIPITVLAQSQDSASVVEAARRAREQKQHDVKDKPAKRKVITDDDLDAKNVKPGEEGVTTAAAAPQLETEPPPQAAVAAEAADKASETSPPDAPRTKADSPEVASIKEQLAQAEKDLQIGQRELALEQDTLFSKPDYQHDTAGKTKVDALQQQVNDRQEAVNQLKAKLAAAQAAAHSSPSPQ